MSPAGVGPAHCVALPVPTCTPLEVLGEGGTLQAFPVSNAMLAATPASQSTEKFGYPGAAPAVSANGTANGIVWVDENASPAVLHAYDASNLAHELYNSNQASNNRDQFGTGNKLITPAIADGKGLAPAVEGPAAHRRSEGGPRTSDSP